MEVVQLDNGGMELPLFMDKHAHDSDGIILVNRIKPHTAFHATCLPLHQRFALPRELHDAGVRRYGFHGLSYEYIAGRLPEVDAAAATGGSGEHEPMIFTVTYGKGRVFHTPMGHSPETMHCVGFITTLLRGAEWAATGEVTVEVPDDFPTAEKSSKRE